MKENTSSKHSIHTLIKARKLKIWELEAVVPEFANAMHSSHRFPEDRHSPMTVEHYHYAIDIYRLTYIAFYRKRIGWND